MATVDVTRVAGNIGALNALYSLQNINAQLAIHQTRLASGKRLNEASDDPAGMSIATSFDVRRQGLKTALSAIGDAKNLMSTMEGGLRKVQEILVKMRNKAMEAQGDTIGANERAAIRSQLLAFRNEINDIVRQTQWNNNYLLVGSGGSGSTAALNFLTGPESTGGTSQFSFVADTTSGIAANQGFYADTSALGATGLGLADSKLVVDTTANAQTAMQNIEAALNVVKAGISQVGAFTARLTFKEEALAVQYTNTESAYNRIMNANMAEEQVEASKFLILQQTATAMLAQANVAPQFLLSLFR
ncbi:MAG: flagellin [Anaerolineales bacterium]|nr:flagellin [Anaerolineales bacterium]